MKNLIIKSIELLKEIGYLKEEEVILEQIPNLDSEISSIAGPQLVVPIMNSRYTLNAANARWVSLQRQFIWRRSIGSGRNGSESMILFEDKEVIRFARNFLGSHFSINEIIGKI